MGASHSVSWDASVGRDASEGPLLVITAEALAQLTSQIKEQHEAKQPNVIADAPAPAFQPEETQLMQKERQMLEGYWSRRLEVYKKQNEDLKEKLDSLSQVQLKLPLPKFSSPLDQGASQQQQKLESCLLVNRKQPLKCCNEVRQFEAWIRGQ